MSQFNSFEDIFGYFFNMLSTINPVHCISSMVIEIIDNWLGLSMVLLQPVLDSRFCIILTTTT